MADTHPADMDLLEAAAALQTREMSSIELTAACLERRAGGSAGPLTGLPLALKDVIGAAPTAPCSRAQRSQCCYPC